MNPRDFNEKIIAIIANNFNQKECFVSCPSDMEGKYIKMQHSGTNSKKHIDSISFLTYEKDKKDESIYIIHSLDYYNKNQLCFELFEIGGSMLDKKITKAYKINYCNLFSIKNRPGETLHFYCIETKNSKLLIRSFKINTDCMETDCMKNEIGFFKVLNYKENK